MTARLLLVTTPPEDDPCQSIRPGGVPCMDPEREHATHPFVAPRTVTAEHMARALGDHGHADLGGILRVRGNHLVPYAMTDCADGILAALTAPREDGA